ncbi:MAG: prepilin peptidase [Candidatus Dormibacteraeota bacterium]|nr:prepilin peptidase [Candidatus Dormibacteraeota bacterium]
MPDAGQPLIAAAPWVVALVWLPVGAVTGLGVRWLSVGLARWERLEPAARPWQVYGPVAATALLFAAFAARYGLSPMLLIRSLWAALLVHVIFFDLEHHLILDRVLVPSAVAALLLSFVTPDLGWLQAILTGLGTGLVFLAIAVVGSFVFKAEAMGLGDVKFSALMGLMLGFPAILSAVFSGVILAGVIAVVLVVFRLRNMRDSIAYGPFLAMGALLALFRPPGT